LKDIKGIDDYQVFEKRTRHVTTNASQR